ncbi:hypothetical protein ACJ73_07816 [Blastomyces percursus]|uniref:Uncharacterized protein n=1 Tax=Blastomyces percursus TaxID=1658174 RepID=A0A1J9QXD0_9EURO|nr:hypothetical protein ACJ73_07816 [Blastomyces percursus]
MERVCVDKILMLKTLILTAPTSEPENMFCIKLETERVVGFGQMLVRGPNIFTGGSATNILSQANDQKKSPPPNRKTRINGDPVHVWA